MKHFLPLLSLLLLPLTAWTQPAPRVDVILWFDTEDYLLPADDDACKRLAQMLSERHIRATFKVVGEKARVLKQRGRNDVISALKQHDIAYHSDYHSVHPTPTEYLANCDLLEGIAEFVRREGPGAADIRRIFDVETLSCYGQPGSSWAPQAALGLKAIGVAPAGVPCYVDEGTHVGLDEKPFWYGGALTVYHMGQNYTRMELHEPDALAPAKEKVSGMAKRLQAEGGGLISIFYHPCEWVHVKFWDGVNFARGANPSREQWKAPPQRTAAETDAAFERFGQYIDHIQSLPGVRFVTAGELPTIYPDEIRSRGISREQLRAVCASIADPGSKGLNYFVSGKDAISVADQFELLATAVGGAVEGQELRFPMTGRGLQGPDRAAPQRTCGGSVDAAAFRSATLAVAKYVRVEGRVPAEVFVGADSLPPGDFLVALARAGEAILDAGHLPDGPIQTGENVEILPARHVAADTPQLFGDWIIHKEGFRAPKLMELARLQAWTLKPAIRR